MNHLLDFATMAAVYAAVVLWALVFCGGKKKPGKNIVGNSDDTFDQHVPVKREARRAEEIRKGKPVAAGRDDYKTFNKKNMPESDFDKTMSGINQQLLKMAASSVDALFHRPAEEVAVKEKEIFEYLEGEVVEKKRSVTYKEVAEKVDYYFVEVARLVTKFYEAHKDDDGLTAIFHVSGVKWKESEAEFEKRKASNPATSRRFILKNQFATAAEVELFRQGIDEMRQQMVYCLKFEDNTETVEDLLKQDEKLISETKDIEQWFKRCWWRRGDPEKCREKMLRSGAVDMHSRVTKDAHKYQAPLSKGPLPNPSKPVIKKPKVEEKVDKKISALFNKAMEKKKKHVKQESPKRAVTAAEKEEILQTSPLFKKQATRRIRIDSESEDESENVEKKEPTPPPKANKSLAFDKSNDLFTTGSRSPSPMRMDVDDEPQEEKPKPKKEKAAKAKKSTAKRDVFKPEESEKESKPSTSISDESEGPKTVKSTERGHETYMDEDGFLVTSQKAVVVEKDAPKKAPLKRSNAPESSVAAPPAKKPPKGQSKISSFFSAPKK